MADVNKNLEGIQIKDAHLKQCLLGKELLLIDGAMGTQIQAGGLDGIHKLPELLNFSHAKEISEIHKAYVCAGAEVITTNTFGANRIKLEGSATVSDVFKAAVACARAAKPAYVAGDIGPIGSLLAPMGTMKFSEAYDVFAEQVKACALAGCDLILIETIADLREAKAAVLAARENSNLPVFVTMTFGEDGRTFLGNTPLIAAEVLTGVGAHAIGINCSLGPSQLKELAHEMTRRVKVPVIVQPNAGLPEIDETGKSVYNVLPEEFSSAMNSILDAGVEIIGGCCGTTPEYTRSLKALINARKKPAAHPYKPALVIASAQQACVLCADEPHVCVIGERINPTGKPKLQAALRAKNFDYIVSEAVRQQDCGADALDVNVGLPGIDEVSTLQNAVETLASTTTLPLCVDSSNIKAIEATVRSYAGKVLVNSVNGKQESMEEVFPIVAKYGCATIGLTLDENGIPQAAKGRFEIAKRIVNTAAEYGIDSNNIVIDCLTMACATNQAEALEILEAIHMVKTQLGVRCVLGVSNISFGLPARDRLNTTFLAAALGVGLDMPILNPLSKAYQDTINTFRVLNCQDKAATCYIKRYANEAVTNVIAPQNTTQTQNSSNVQDSGNNNKQQKEPDSAPLTCPIDIPKTLQDSTSAVVEMVGYILHGRKEPMPKATESLIVNHNPLDVVNGVFVPALDIVGKKFDTGEFFLPQLMASAEAVKAGFDVVRASIPASSSKNDVTHKIVVATVKGDIHDIGKNIVKMLLENYGFNVVDLGRDVAPEKVLETVQAQDIKLVGLSALMTTTLDAMKETIELLHAKAPKCKVFVGGAVLTQDYAMKIGANYYCKDAAQSARLAEKFFA